MINPRASQWILCAFALWLAPSCSNLGLGSRPIKPSELPLAKAEVAWKALASGKLTEEQELKAAAQYRAAVASIIADLTDQKTPRRWTDHMTVGTFPNSEKLRIDMGLTTHQVWRPHLIDELDFSKRRHPPEVEGLKRAGLGLPIMGVRKVQDSDPNKKFLPPKGQFLPVTAFVEFPEGEAPILRLYDPREVQEVKLGKKKRPLAADFYSPTHASLQRRGFVRIALGGLVRPERWLDKQGLFLLEPYRSDKIPVVLIHGLLSDPHIWENQVSALMADPELGPKIQCWYFVYPTGLPVSLSAQQLRSALRGVEAIEDPNQDDAAPHRMLLVGHSMGGLLARMQAIDSGNDFWNSYFAKPPEDLPLDSQTKKSLTDVLFFKHDPYVKRLVFIATPHKGSQVADGWLGKMASSLIRLPLATLKTVSSIVTLDAEYLNPDRDGITAAGLNSIAALSPNNPLNVALAKRPILAPSHSIIGNLNKPADIRDSTDGVVPYWSSHLPSAKSELVVPYWHGCVEMPETVGEVRRITRLHVLGK